MLVDTGETAAARDVPFAQIRVGVEEELPGVLAAVGLSLGDVSRVVLTRHHGDHADGLVHISVPVWVHDVELAFAESGAQRRRSHHGGRNARSYAGSYLGDLCR